jgi:GNAT superfamily N-acetyltransferase
MEAECRELATDQDFDQAGEVQRRVFGFSDLDLVSPLQLRLVARQNPPQGLHLGIFVDEAGESRLAGVVLAFATFWEKAVYAALIGLLPEYQGRGLGRQLMAQFREAALGRGLKTLYGVFDPLDEALAGFYIAGLGLVGIEWLDGKVLFRWDLGCERTVARLGPRPHARGTGVPSPLVSSGSLPGDQEVFFEAPGTAGEARTVLSEYLNVRGYTWIDCITLGQGDRQTSYYVLRKTQGDGVV